MIDLARRESNARGTTAYESRAHGTHGKGTTWPGVGGALKGLFLGRRRGGVLVTLALAGATLGWGVGAPPARAQDVQVPGDPGITVIGDGSATAQPDTTTIRLGVDVTAPTPAEALNRTRSGADQVVQRLRERGVPEGDLQTSGLNVYPIQGPTRDGPPDPTVISGYRGNATITAQARDVTQVGGLLDAAIQAGATSVQGLNFGIRDDSALRRRAITAALAVARPQAEAAAAASGLTITGVRSIVEIPLGVPAARLGGGLGGGAGDGIASGELSVVVRVQVTFDIAR